MPAPRQLSCPCGHAWTYTGPDPVPADVRRVCPVCSAPGRAPATFAAPAEEPARSTASADPDPGTAADPPPPEPAPDAVPGYELLGVVGRGGMGVVYKARQLAQDRLVALKMLAPDCLGPTARRRFRREVRAAARLDHPNIVAVYDTDLDGPRPFLAMEFVDGIDLDRLVKQAGPLPVADACRYVAQVARGLQHAFERRMVHRDVKPANLMVSPSPLDRPPPEQPVRVKILDLGLARVVTPAGGPDSGSGELTRAGAFLGTPDYIAPEQAEDPSRADVRSDLYSLGGTLFYLLAGEPPFPGRNPVARIRRVLTEPPPRLADRRPDVPAAVEAIVRRLLAPDPAERFQTPAELLDALDAADVRAAGPVSFGPARIARAHDGGVPAVAVAPDGKTVLTGGADGRLRVWAADTLGPLRSFAGDAGSIVQVCVARGGDWAVSCGRRRDGSDGGVRVWDAASGRELARLAGPTDPVCLAASADGRWVAAGDAEGAVWLWGPDRTDRARKLAGHPGPVTAVLFLPPGEPLLSVGSNGVFRQWDPETGQPGRVFPLLHGLAAVAFDPVTRRLAAAGGGLVVREPDGALVPCRGHDGRVLAVALAPGGKRVASGGADGTVRVWQAQRGTELARLAAHPGGVAAVAWSPDGQSLYTGGRDGTLRRWWVPE